MVWFSCGWQGSYGEFFQEGLKAASLQHSVEGVVAMAALPSDVAIEYDGEADFRGVAGRFGVFQDWRVRGTYLPTCLVSFRFFRIFHFFPFLAFLCIYEHPSPLLCSPGTRTDT